MAIGNRQPGKATNPIVAVFCGTIISLVLGYGGSYLLTKFGLGVVGFLGDHGTSGPGVLMRAALNLYAIQHITLIGTQGQPAVSAQITLPLTLWACVPCFALLIGGYCAAKLRAERGRWTMVVTALAAGVVYAIVLTAVSRVLFAHIDTYLMPDIGGISSNPPEIPFRALTKSALAFASLFGVICTYLGALIAMRGVEPDYIRGRWWACGKAIILLALIFQLLICIALGVWTIKEGKQADDSTNAGHSRVIEMLPTASGLTYAMMHGASLTGSAQTQEKSSKNISRMFFMQVNIYDSIRRDDVGSKSVIPMQQSVKIAVIVLGCIVVFWGGFLAVRWGSRDGSVFTAFRIALLHTAYLAILVQICNISLLYSDPFSTLRISIASDYGRWLVLSFVGTFIVALIGAQIANSRLNKAPVVIPRR